MKYVCNRCGHVQDNSFQCGVCGWGDLYPQKNISKGNRLFISAHATSYLSK